ncbi:hypothetical protein TNCV_1201931 [Trichonephila clavipes]|nr:hypothetical protein TNCV_1201931 [Trichonephila clavipes]
MNDRVKDEGPRDEEPIHLAPGRYIRKQVKKRHECVNRKHKPGTRKGGKKDSQDFFLNKREKSIIIPGKGRRR